MSLLILRRLGLGVVTLWVVSLLIFAGTEILPGDVAQAILGQSATPENVAALRVQLGLDRPALVRYGTWLLGMAQGDLGISLASGMEISFLIADRFVNTLVLAGLTAGFAVPLAVMLGAAAAMFPGSLFDKTVTISTLCVISVPEFFIAAVFVLIFAVKLRWLPAITYISEYESFWQLVRSLALPILTLLLAVLSHMARMTRAALLNVMNSPYVEMAILKGVPRRRIILRHALFNAVGPIVNVIALNLAYLVSGVVIVETVFAYPGLARLMVDAVSRRDMPLVQSCAMIFCAAYVLLILLADILAILANPRLRHPR